jgi:hypothetical protein
MPWARLVETAKSPELAKWDEERRTPIVKALYSARGCSLDIDFATEWLLVPNEYPYDVESDVSHFVLFRRHDLTMVSPLAYLKIFGGYDVVWFETPPGLRSIPAVRHYHVFVRPFVAEALVHSFVADSGSGGFLSGRMDNHVGNSLSEK